MRKDVTQKLETPAANAADSSLIDRVRERAAGQQSTARWTDDVRDSSISYMLYTKILITMYTV